MSIRCREARAADQPCVVELLVAQLADHSLCPPRAVLETGVARLVSDPLLGRVLVADVDGEIAGVAVMSWVFSLEHGGRSVWLDELYVLPEHRGHGVGTALLRAACARASADGAVAMDLEVEAGHERAFDLYARLGFTRHERQRWFLRLPLDASSSLPLQFAPRTLDGGCLCGAIRYRITALAEDVTHCHCTLCRRSTGAPFVTWLTVPTTAITFTKGTPAERRSTPHAVRTFCEQCGTALTFREGGRPRSVDVTAGSLDAPERIVPREHTFVASKVSWLLLGDDLPRYAEANPTERDCE